MENLIYIDFFNRVAGYSLFLGAQADSRPYAPFRFSL